jgi:hypothetical protein
LFTSNSDVKWRSTPGPTVYARQLYYDETSKTYKEVSKLTAATGGIQITESEGNHWPPSSKGDFVDSGSEFYTRKVEIIPSRIPFHSISVEKRPDNSLSFSFKVEGQFLVANAWGSLSAQFADFADPRYMRNVPYTDSSSTKEELYVKGAQAIAACAPTNQIAEVSTALGELLQDVPKLPGIGLWKSQLRAAELAAAASGEFLNGVFGILPTVNDMTQFYTGVHKVDKAVDQFIRDSGRVVRRQFHFPKERTVTEEVVPNSFSPVGCGPNVTNLYNAPSRCLPVYETIRTSVVERETWFSGAFTYYLPDWFDNSRSSRMALTARLLGVRPDVTTLWNLAPWSWAVDWLVDAGTFVENVASHLNYGTVMRYGYVMEKTTTTDTYSAGKVYRPVNPIYATGFRSRPYPTVSPIQVRTTVKKRVQANPFGFGVSWDGLSTIQRAIVAALGISRAVR